MSRVIAKASVLIVLSRHIGKERGIHAEKLVYEILGFSWQPAPAANLRRLREVVTELRLEGNHVCAHPKNGYFMAANDQELNDTCEFLYSRSMKSLKQISAMKKISLPDLRGQLHLPT